MDSHIVRWRHSLEPFPGFDREAIVKHVDLGDVRYVELTGHRTAGQVLRDLHVGLVERVDSEDRSSTGHGHLEHEHCPTDFGEIVQSQASHGSAVRHKPGCGLIERVGVFLDEDEDPVAAHRSGVLVACQGHDPAPILACRLGDELLDPRDQRTKAPRREKRRLVLAGNGQLTKHRTESQGWVVARIHLGSAPNRRIERALPEAIQVDSNRRSRNEAEVA